MKLPQGITLTALSLIGWLATAAAQAPLSLPSLIEEALANNPSLATLQYRLEVARARIPQAGSLMDPMLKFEFDNVPLSDFDFDSTPMSGKQLSISQRFPYWGKLDARERMAKHSAAAAGAAYEDREAAVVNIVKQAYYTLAFLDRSIEITEQNEALLGDFIRIAQTKYSVGKGLQQDVLKAQVSLSSLKDRLIVSRHRRLRVEAEMNSVLNRPPQAPLGPTPTIVQTAFAQDSEALQRTAIEQRPMLNAMEERLHSLRAAEDLARKEYRPDFDVSLGYRQRSFDRDPVEGSDFVSAGVMLNLPIYRGRKQDQKLLETRARLRAAETEHHDHLQQVKTRVHQLCVDIAMHGEQVALFKTAIIPQADQSLASAITAYQVDRVDFLTLLNNQVTLFNFEIDYYRHLTDYERKLAELEAVVGARLF